MGSTHRKSVTRSDAEASTTSRHPLTEDYIRWLEPQIRDRHDNQGETYWDLLGLMFEKEFISFVAHDENRVADGVDLRSEFCFQRELPTDCLKDAWPPSFAEVLVSLSRRLSFDAGGRARGWAWTLMNNLELHRMSDPLTRRKIKQVDDILETCIRRTYAPDGQGGFFPLAWPEEDQREVELWYQMAAYINELHPEH